ncbi:DUF6503 family protein [uncultured Psychroserpens sp.]|uniref:DUF6503 family protein n=1 Tax=uncultured Psychroserpens sp. TaxID=255436 RepID=UPI0026040618|nr:DUF6503 family protein [uncultured Psychroserpens sp.]
MYKSQTIAYSIFTAVIFIFFNCKNKETPVLSADTIITKAIEVSGGAKIDSSLINFDFRDKHYMAYRNKGVFHFERKFRDTTSRYFDTINTITDILNNKGFMRLADNFPISVTDTMVTKYSASINSVHYFSVLPYGLNDKAVNKELLSDVSIKGKDYYTIKVTFDQEGGGEDFEDVFLYWVNRETFKVDYLAYSYNEEDGKGLRFREAYNQRIIEGIRFVDYNNYKPESASVELIDLAQLFQDDALKLLSKIELENVTVNSALVPDL